jgi:hypothetical protein
MEDVSLWIVMYLGLVRLYLARSMTGSRPTVPEAGLRGYKTAVKELIERGVLRQDAGRDDRWSTH